MNLDDFASRLPNARKTADGYSSTCPAHEDRKDSLSVSKGDDDRILVHCFAGCSPEAITRKMGLTVNDLFSANGYHKTNGSAKRKRAAKKDATEPKEKKPKKPKKNYPSRQGIVMAILRRLAKGADTWWWNIGIVRAWQYGDSFEVVRFDLPTPAGEKQRKEIRPIHRTTDGGKEVWRHGYPMATGRPLYNRAALNAAPVSEIPVVNAGEKATDATTSIGLLATTNAGGELAIGKTDWTPLLRFPLVVAVIDNDKTGEKSGELVTAKLKKLNPDIVVKIVRVSDAPKGDMYEAVRDGMTKEKFLELVTAAPEATAKDDQEEGIVKQLADEICLTSHFAVDVSCKLYRYDTGVFKPRAERFINRQVKAILELWGKSACWSSKCAAEVAEYIRVDAPELPERPRGDLISCINGVVRVEDGILLPHNPEHRFTFQIPVVYDPAATCPFIDRFVSQVFPADAVCLAWEIPASIIGILTSIQEAILLLGEGANGKSTWLSLLVTFIGRGNVSSLSLHRLECDKFSAARLVGKLANVCPDLPSEHLAGTSVFKIITGGNEPLTGEHKFGTSFEFYPFARLVFSANHPPRSADASHAFFRRWLPIPFDKTFGPDEQRPREILDAELSAPGELSGMFNRCLDALRKMRVTRRFSKPASVQQAWQDFRATTDPVAVWLDRFTIDAPECIVTQQHLRVACNAAAEREGRPALTAKSFGQAIARLRPAVEKKQKKVAGKLQWCYVGIGLSHPDDGGNSQDSRDSRDYPYFVSRGENEEQEKQGEQEAGGGQEQDSGNRVNRVNPVNPVEPGNSDDCTTRGLQHEWEITKNGDGKPYQQCKICKKFYGYVRQPCP